MDTFKLKSGPGADAKIICEDADEKKFAAQVAEELAKLPLGLPMLMSVGPVVELPNGKIVPGLQLQRWLAQVTGGWRVQSHQLLCKAVRVSVQIEVETNGSHIRNATCAVQIGCRRHMLPADFETAACPLLEA